MKQLVLALFLVLSPLVAFGDETSNFLQNVSVTVRADTSSGSGVLITRDIKKTKDGPAEKYNFVLTAGHVVDSLRSIRTVVDSKTGTEKKIVDFRPVYIVKDLVEDGRQVGEMRIEGHVISYSESEDGHDLAVIMLHKKNFVTDSAKFFLDGNKQVDLGTRLWHVGSRQGIISQSMTDGIMSKIGLVLTINNRPIIFDVVTTPISPGSSGGGVFLAEGNHKGEVVGLVVRGGDATLGLIVPIRRIWEYVDNKNIEWLLDNKLPTPTLDELEKLPVE